MQIAIESNSGTTFVRKGGDLNVKIKSNVQWEFTLVNIDDDHKDMEINYYYPQVGDRLGQYTLGYGEATYITYEGEQYPVGTNGGEVDTNVVPTWLHILNNMGNKVNTVTGSGTTIITINADENLTGKFRYALGFARATNEEDSNLGAWCKFMIYDKAYYTIFFDSEDPVYEETDTGHTNPITIHTFNGITYEEEGNNGKLIYSCDTHTDIHKEISLPKTDDNLNYTYIPFNVYTTTPCRITMDGAFGQNQYDIPKGITINTEDIPYGDNHEPNHENIYFFKVPTNKEYGKNVSYTIKATSKEDDTCVKFYEVVLKTEASINICADNTEISAEDKKFFVNYTGVPETMIFRINVYQGSENNLVQTYDCHGSGTVYYQADENVEEDELTFIVNAVSIDGKIKGKVCGGDEGNLIFTQGGYDPPEPPTPETSGITLSPSSKTIGKDETSFSIDYEGTPSGLLFNVAVFDSEGNKVKDDQLCAGRGSVSYTCGINEEENDRTFTVSASTSDGVYTATATVTQTHGEGPEPPSEKLFQWEDMSEPATVGITYYSSYNSITSSVTKTYSVTGYTVSDVTLETTATGITMSRNGNSVTVSITGGARTDNRSAIVYVKEGEDVIGMWYITLNIHPTFTIRNNSSKTISVNMQDCQPSSLNILSNTTGSTYLNGTSSLTYGSISSNSGMIGVDSASASVYPGTYPANNISIDISPSNTSCEIVIVNG